MIRITQIVRALFASSMLGICLACTAATAGDGKGEKAEACVNGLKLSLNVDRERMKCGEKFTLTATFENVSGEPLKFYVPHAAGAETFPEIRFKKVSPESGARGPVFRRTIPPYQTFIREGILGTVVTLKPGEKKVFGYGVKDVVPEGIPPRGVRTRHLPLAEGIYEITASYAKADANVPYRNGWKPVPGFPDLRGFGFEVKKKAIEGLWTGTVTAAPVKLAVGPPEGVACTIDAPDSMNPGGPLIIEVTIRNHTGNDLAMECVPRVNAGMKAAGGGYARFSLDGASSDLPEGETAPLRLPKGAGGSYRVDLSRLNYLCTMGRYKGKGPVGFYDLFGPGALHVSVDLDFVSDEQHGPVKSNDLYVSLTDRAPKAIPGLSLDLAAEEGVQDAGKPLFLDVKLLNNSERALMVSDRMDFPSRLYLVVADAEGKKGLGFSCTGKPPTSIWDLEPSGSWHDSALIVSGLSWNSDGFERGKRLLKEDFIVLEPGKSIGRRIDLDLLVHGGLKAGRYRIRAYYRNLDDGMRLGLEDPALVGLVTSEPIEIQIRNK